MRRVEAIAQEMTSKGALWLSSTLLVARILRIQRATWRPSYRPIRLFLTFASSLTTGSRKACSNHWRRSKFMVDGSMKGDAISVDPPKGENSAMKDQDSFLTRHH